LAKDLNALNNAKNIDAAKDKQLNSTLSSGIHGARSPNDRNQLLRTATGSATYKTTNAVANIQAVFSNSSDNLKKINTKLNTNATPKTSINTGTKTNSSGNAKSSVAAKPSASTFPNQNKDQHR
jgi:hypothetical protein